MKRFLRLKERLDPSEWKRDKVEPYPESGMVIDGYPKYTICGVLREIYKESNNEQIKLLARIATSMAKKMSNRLLYYYGQSKG
jgi:hypothetical protein